MDKNWWKAPAAALVTLVICVAAGLANAGLL
jgi:hypothetical protein